jgi:hypothetical protein
MVDYYLAEKYAGRIWTTKFRPLPLSNGGWAVSLEGFNRMVNVKYLEVVDEKGD